jgi:hypothetical protein
MPHDLRVGDRVHDDGLRGTVVLGDEPPPAGCVWIRWDVDTGALNLAVAAHLERVTEEPADLPVDISTTHTSGWCRLTPIAEERPDTLVLSTETHRDLADELEEAGAFAAEVAVKAARFPHACPVCHGPSYLGWSNNEAHREHPEGVVCPPVEPEPYAVERAQLPPREGAPHVLSATPEHGWAAVGDGVLARHPLREGAITAWREALRQKEATR